MRLRCFLIGFILLGSASVQAQVSGKFEYPMTNIIKMSVDDGTDINNPGASPSFTITFNSKDSLVYAINQGTVNSVINVDSAFVVLIKYKDSSYAYSNLKAVAIKQGDEISDGQVIGYADFDTDKNCYLLDMIITDGKDILLLKKKNFVPRLQKTN